MTLSLSVLKRGLVFFWAAWFTVVFLTNLFDLLKQLGIVGADWAFASGNFGFMLATTGLYATPESVVLLLFVGVIVWEAVAAGLFWRGFAGYGGGAASLGRVNTAFAVGLALWAAFLLADELTMAYDVASTHMGLLTAQTVTLLAIHLLPDATNR